MPSATRWERHGKASAVRYHEGENGAVVRQIKQDAGGILDENGRIRAVNEAKGEMRLVGRVPANVANQWTREYAILTGDRPGNPGFGARANAYALQQLRKSEYAGFRATDRRF